MTRETMHELMDRWLSALSGRDVATYTRLYAGDAVVESPLGGVMAGTDRIREAFENFYATFPDATISSEPACIDGTRAVMVATIAGTHLGPLSGFPGSGRPFRFPLVFVLDVRDGLIIRDRRIYDFTGLLVQIGMLKAKPKDH